jgi:hypothetical protein
LGWCLFFELRTGCCVDPTSTQQRSPNRTFEPNSPTSASANLDQLVSTRRLGYDIDDAAQLVIDQLLGRLAGSPSATSAAP